MTLPTIFAWMNISKEKAAYEENKEAVRESNTGNFHYLTISIAFVLLITSILGIFTHYGLLYVTYYFSNTFATAALFFIFRLKSPKVRKISLPLIYFTTAIFYTL
ncbi:MAG: hypothetical protein II054_02735, partial [Treponema sp.]|nr:hypothetical protein [Treponema sp.]